MSEDPLIVTYEDHIATITLNRPHRRNALNPPLMKRLTNAAADLANDRDVRVVVLTGAGGAFCSGGDIKAADDVKKDKADEKQVAKARTLEDRVQWLRNRMEAARILHQMPKPTIAMIRGPAAGAGLNLAGACDLRIASENAVFVSSFARVGGSGDYGGAYFWTRILGTAKARELFYLSDKIQADAALAYGLVNRVVPDTSLEPETMAIAKRLATGSPATYRYMKKTLNAAEEGPLEQILDMEALHMTLSGMAARRAFIEAKKSDSAKS